MLKIVFFFLHYIKTTYRTIDATSLVYDCGDAFKQKLMSYFMISNKGARSQGARANMWQMMHPDASRRGLRASRRGLRAIWWGLLASQRGLRASRRGLRASQSGLRASQRPTSCQGRCPITTKLTWDSTLLKFENNGAKGTASFTLATVHISS